MLSKSLRTLRTLALLFPFACSPLFAAGASVIINPTSHNYGIEAVDLKTTAFDFQVTNFGTSTVNVTSFDLSSTAFELPQGVAPVKLLAGQTTHYTVLFAPTKAQVYTGTFNVHIDNGQNLSTSLTGTGQTTTAKAVLSTNMLAFGTVPQGQKAKQTVTITNSGGQSVTLSNATTQPPFSVTAAGSLTIPPGGTLPLNVTFNPTTVGPVSGLIVLSYSSLPTADVVLSATVTAPTTLAVVSFPTLPAATQSAKYQAYFAAAGGTAPYSWQLQSGSTLPAGLTLGSDGTITGTVASSVTAGTYNFNVSVNDSSIPKLAARQQVTLTVGKPNGANCNNISFNVANTSTPIQGLDVLGTGTYLGAVGGLYPNGSNIRPIDHTSYGIGLAQGIQPLNANGLPDPNGKEVIVLIGESNVHTEGDGIAEDANADPQKNPAVLVVNAGLGDGTAAVLADPNSAFWTTILDYIIPNYGVTPMQVVAAWIEPTDALNTGVFPGDIATLQGQIESETRNLHTLFPNLKMAYLSSRIYAGYSNGVSTTNPEPYAYEDGFAVKYSIQDQLDGINNLNFAPSKGPVAAPWMSWGPYTWADGLVVPSTTGHLWSCQDVKGDGIHPTKTSGKEEVANQVVQFFKSDPTTTPWYLAP